MSAERARVIEKAVAAVVRRAEGRRELLVFRHPLAGVQIPKGTMEPGETIAEAALRELEEESGLALACTPDHIGTWERVLASRIEGDGMPRVHPWHVCLMDAPPGLPESWSHCATGSPEEEGLIFDYRWLAIDAALPAALHPLFDAVSRMLLDHFADDR